MEVNLPKKASLLKKCNWCGDLKPTQNFAFSKSPLEKDNLYPICNECLRTYLAAADFKWNTINELCRVGNIPFVPKEWTRLFNLNKDNTFPIYAKTFAAAEFDGLDWETYELRFKELEDANLIDGEIPRLAEKKRIDLMRKWGPNYEDYELEYLENLYDGLLKTQNIGGALQHDQALKICKISLKIDSCLRADEPIDKLLSAYDRIVKVGEFTPKNVKNASDFDSFGEVAKWLEKRGWKPNFHNDVARDIVDETIKNIQNFNQRLYTNESGIGEEISRRIEALKNAEALTEKPRYGVTYNDDELDNYDKDGYEHLAKNDEFEVEI